MFVWHCGSPFLLFIQYNWYFRYVITDTRALIIFLPFVSIISGFSQHDPFTFPWDIQLTGATAVCNTDPNRSCPSAKTGIAVCNIV
jgi:hypothetical protein